MNHGRVNGENDDINQCGNNGQTPKNEGRDHGIGGKSIVMVCTNREAIRIGNQETVKVRHGQETVKKNVLFESEKTWLKR